MNPTFPSLPTNLFMVLTIVLFFMILGALRGALRYVRHSNQTGAVYATSFVTAGWLIALAMLSRQGFFQALDVFPPRIMIALVVPTIAIVGLAIYRPLGEILDELPLGWFIFPQVFRVVVEIVLWQMGEAGKTPVQMTFEGMNFDILAGITAPLIAFICFGQGRQRIGLAIVWNILGMALLLNIIGIAILSIPAIGVLEPANTFVAWFPFVWLPGFVAPFALFLHVMSLRQLIRRRKARNKTAE